MLTQRVFILTLLLFTTGNLFAQTNNPQAYKVMTLQDTGHYKGRGDVYFLNSTDLFITGTLQKNFWGEIGIKNYFRRGIKPSYFTWLFFAGYMFSIESNFNGNDFIFAPKLSGEFEPYILGGRIDFAYFTNLKGGDVCFIPQIAARISNGFTFYYGWNIPLTNNRFTEIYKQRISLSIDLVRHWF